MCNISLSDVSLLNLNLSPDKLGRASSSVVVFFFTLFVFGNLNLATESLVSLFDKSNSDSLFLGESDNGVLALTDSENVLKSGGKGVTSGISDVGNFVRTGMVLDVLEDAD